MTIEDRHAELAGMCGRILRDHMQSHRPTGILSGWAFDMAISAAMDCIPAILTRIFVSIGSLTVDELLGLRAMAERDQSGGS